MGDLLQWGSYLENAGKTNCGKDAYVVLLTEYNPSIVQMFRAVPFLLCD